MDKNVLLLERPALAEVPVQLERDNLAIELNEDLAQYAESHFGYKVLSQKLEGGREKCHEQMASIAVQNRLPGAILQADIPVYNRESVEKYKKETVRQMKFDRIFGRTRWVLWLSAILLTLSVICGCLTITFSIQWLGGLPATIGFIALIAEAFIVWVAYDRSKFLRIEWRRATLGNFREEIPLFALDQARSIHKLCPTTKFMVEGLEIGDPFLVAIDPQTEEEFYIAVWDEPRFEAENR